MSQENVEFVRRFWALVNVGRVDQAVEPLPEDFVWIDLPTLPGAAERRGPQGVLASYRNVTAAFSEITFEIERVAAATDEVVVIEMRASGTGQQSSATSEIRYGLAWHFRGDTPVKAEHFASLTEALEAAGLPE